MSDARQPEEAGIGLRQYLDVLRRRKWTVLVMLALAVGASSFLTLREQSIYQAEATVAVGQGNTLFSAQNGNSIQPFAATMKELLESTVIAQGVIHDLKLDLTPTQLLSKVSVSFNPDSAALHVSVLDHAPARAKAIAASMSTHFTNLVAERFGANARGSSDVVRAFVWDPAHVVPGRVSPTPTRNLLIAAVLGLVLGLLAAFLRDHFDRSLRTTDEIEKAFGVPVIAQIPSLRKGSKERPRMLWDENGEFAESFRGLRANLQYLAVQRPLKTILVTSPAANQGKTTVCANLATAIAQSGGSVLLLEADLRRPTLSKAFGLPRGEPGLTSVLVGNTQLGRATITIELPEHPGQGDNERAVTVLPSGPLPPNPSELVASPRMRRLVDGLGDLFDTVIVDSPPILPVADTLGLAKLVDGVIVVVRAKSATRDEAREVRAMVERLEIPLVGIVVSDVDVRGGYGTYGSYTSFGHDQPDPAAHIEASIERLRAKNRAASGATAARASSDR